MSDYDKMQAFGSWLTSRKVVLTGELYALSVNREAPLDAIRIKAGHVEAMSSALDAFTELYHGELQTFMKDRLGVEATEEDE